MSLGCSGWGWPWDLSCPRPAGLAWDSSLIFRSQQGTWGPRDWKLVCLSSERLTDGLESFLICKMKITEASFLGGFED